MQTVKEKLSDMKEMRKVKAEAKAQEQEEKELSKARVDIAHEVRLAREAEGTMDLHVAKAGQKAEKEIAKHTAHQKIQNQPLLQSTTQSNVGPPNNPYGQNYTDSPAGSTAAGMGNATNIPAESPPKNDLVPPNFNIFSSK